MDFPCDPFRLTLLNAPLGEEADLPAASVIDLTDYQRPSSRHVLTCREADGTEHTCVLLASAGATGVHTHSLAVVEGHCFVAVGDHVCALTLPSLALSWATEVDWATCFGIYSSPRHRCLISHGELSVARVSLAGAIEWSAGGSAIFTEGFRLDEDVIEVIDFGGCAYRFDVRTGREPGDAFRPGSDLP